jgi:hypothetical protein
MVEGVRQKTFKADCKTSERGNFRSMSLCFWLLSDGKTGAEGLDGSFP